MNPSNYSNIDESDVTIYVQQGSKPMVKVLTYNDNTLHKISAALGHGFFGGIANRHGGARYDYNDNSDNNRYNNRYNNNGYNNNNGYDTGCITKSDGTCDRRYNQGAASGRGGLNRQEIDQFSKITL